ncbi:hypothetical protein L9F63_009868, partial [Diploptera punctata]
VSLLGGVCLRLVANLDIHLSYAPSREVHGVVGPGSSMLWLSSSDVQGVVGSGSSMLWLSSSDVQDAP